MSDLDNELRHDGAMDEEPEAEAEEASTLIPLDTHDPEFARALDAELGANIAELTPPNRATRRARRKALRRMAIPLDAGVKRMYHPLLAGYLMPHGRKEMAKRRAANVVAKRARQVNRGGGGSHKPSTYIKGLKIRAAAARKAAAEVEGS